jgi:hypothetical protein
LAETIGTDRCAQAAPGKRTGDRGAAPAAPKASPVLIWARPLRA